MRKIYSLLAVVLVSTGMFAQSYYMLPAVAAGFNPGNLNNDDENPGVAGWADIMPSTATDAWSTSQTLPFAFNFDGSPETSYQVSNSGIVTFSSTPGTAPSPANAALPSGLIPAKSVCVWGLNISGANDVIRSKTFGTAPNRQHWISWVSASHSAMSPTQAWAYWSIVLEEGSDKIYIVDQRTFDGNSGNVAITAGVQVSTTNYTEIAGSPSLGSTTTGTAGNQTDVLDNTFYEFSTVAPVDRDMAGLSTGVTGFAGPSVNVNIDGTFRNMGLQTVSSADFNYSVNGGTPVTTTLSGVSFSAGQTKTVASGTSWNTPATPGSYTIKIWLSGINGATDPNNMNDTISVNVSVVTNLPSRKVLIEERTGLWCGWCPRGAVAMEYMWLNNHDDAVLIAVHNGDPMAVSNYDPNLSGGFPTFTADRIMTEQSIGDGTNMEGAMNTRLAMIAAASLDITSLTLTGNSVTVDVESTFIVSENNADYRFALIYYEDGVQDPSYGQANYYAGGGSGNLVDAKGFNYATAPGTVSGLVFNHVARAVEPSFDGAAGSVPSTVALNQKVNYTFNSTVPSSVDNINHLYVAVVLLNNNNGGEVINAAEMKVNSIVGLEEDNALAANVFPNPAQNFFNVELDASQDFTIELVNSVGQVVYANEYTQTAKATVNTADFAKGVYFLNLKSADKSSTMKIAITK